MSDNRYGEPWEVQYDLQYGSVDLYDKDGKGIFLFTGIETNLTRAVLCVNACSGMSDEEVEAGLFTVNQVRKLSHSERDALKAQLDEAVELLVDAKYQLPESESHVWGMIHDFLAKHRSTND